MPLAEVHRSLGDLWVESHGEGRAAWVVRRRVRVCRIVLRPHVHRRSRLCCQLLPKLADQILILLCRLQHKVSRLKAGVPFCQLQNLAEPVVQPLRHLAAGLVAHAVGHVLPQIPVAHAVSGCVRYDLVDGLVGGDRRAVRPPVDALLVFDQPLELFVSVFGGEDRLDHGLPVFVVDRRADVLDMVRQLVPGGRNQRRVEIGDKIRAGVDVDADHGLPGRLVDVPCALLASVCHAAAASGRLGLVYLNVNADGLGDAPQILDLVLRSGSACGVHLFPLDGAFSTQLALDRLSALRFGLLLCRFPPRLLVFNVRLVFLPACIERALCGLLCEIRGHLQSLLRRQHAVQALSVCGCNGLGEPVALRAAVVEIRPVLAERERRRLLSGNAAEYADRRRRVRAHLHVLDRNGLAVVEHNGSQVVAQIRDLRGRLAAVLVGVGDLGVDVAGLGQTVRRLRGFLLPELVLSLIIRPHRCLLIAALRQRLDLRLDLLLQLLRRLGLLKIALPGLRRDDLVHDGLDAGAVLLGHLIIKLRRLGAALAVEVLGDLRADLRPRLARLPAVPLGDRRSLALALALRGAAQCRHGFVYACVSGPGSGLGQPARVDAAGVSKSLRRLDRVSVREVLRLRPGVLPDKLIDCVVVDLVFRRVYGGADRIVRSGHKAAGCRAADEVVHDTGEPFFFCDALRLLHAHAALHKLGDPPVYLALSVSADDLIHDRVGKRRVQFFTTFDSGLYKHVLHDLFERHSGCVLGKEFVEGNLFKRVFRNAGCDSVDLCCRVVQSGFDGLSVVGPRRGRRLKQQPCRFQPGRRRGVIPTGDQGRKRRQCRLLHRGNKLRGFSRPSASDKGNRRTDRAPVAAELLDAKPSVSGRALRRASDQRVSNFAGALPAISERIETGCEIHNGSGQIADRTSAELPSAVLCDPIEDFLIDLVVKRLRIRLRKFQGGFGVSVVKRIDSCPLLLGHLVHSVEDVSVLMRSAEVVHLGGRFRPSLFYRPSVPDRILILFKLLLSGRDDLRVVRDPFAFRLDDLLRQAGILKDALSGLVRLRDLLASVVWLLVAADAAFDRGVIQHPVPGVPVGFLLAADVCVSLVIRLAGEPCSFKVVLVLPLLLGRPVPVFAHDPLVVRQTFRDLRVKVSAVVQELELAVDLFRRHRQRVVGAGVSVLQVVEVTLCGSGIVLDAFCEVLLCCCLPIYIPISGRFSRDILPVLHAFLGLLSGFFRRRCSLCGVALPLIRINGAADVVSEIRQCFGLPGISADDVRNGRSLCGVLRHLSLAPGTVRSRICLPVKCRLPQIIRAFIPGHGTVDHVLIAVSCAGLVHLLIIVRVPVCLVSVDPGSRRCLPLRDDVHKGLGAVLERIAPVCSGPGILFLILVRDSQPALKVCFRMLRRRACISSRVFCFFQTSFKIGHSTSSR